MPALWRCCPSSTPKAERHWHATEDTTATTTLKTSLHQGDLVGVVHKGQVLIGILLSEKGSRATIKFCGQRRDQELPSRELTQLLSVSTAESDQCSLPELSDLRKLVLNQKDLAEGWWLLESERQASDCPATAMAIAELAELLLPQSDGLYLGALWLWLHGDQQWFRLRRDHLVEARASDEIRRLQREHRREQRRQQQRREAMERLRQDAVLSDQQWHQLPEELRKTISHLILLADESQSAFQPNKGECELLQELGVAADHRALCSWLVSKGWRDPHALPSLQGSAWSCSFPDEVLREAEQLVANHQKSAAGDLSRTDLCHLKTYTLDDVHTREIDDGLSLEVSEGLTWIWIHIADPSRLISTDSAVDLEAKIRATSLYLADGSRSMLPMVLAEDALSLCAGRRCPALSVAIELDQQGAVGKTRIMRSWIQPRYRLTYEDGDELIELAPPGDEDLARLSVLMKTRLNWRLSQGAVQIDQPEGRFQVDDQTPELQIIEPSASRQLVSEAMILMGAAIAEFGISHQLPLPYRSQPAAELPTDAELQEITEAPVRYALIRRCLSRGVIGTQPMPHFSLGLPAYVQASSPIRRYGDLLAHRQVLAQLEGLAPMSEATLMAELDQLNDPLRQAQQISREDQRHWQQVWFQNHREQTWPALHLRWLRPQDQLALVHVESLSMDLACRIEGHQDPQPGLRLTLRVGAVEPLINELQLVAS
ncbi:MAG: ribonuclease catalytic domain-containing protein [Prochlorococcus sp.]